MLKALARYRRCWSLFGVDTGRGSGFAKSAPNDCIEQEAHKYKGLVSNLPDLNVVDRSSYGIRKILMDEFLPLHVQIPTIFTRENLCLLLQGGLLEQSH